MINFNTYQELQNFYNSLPKMIQNQLQLISKNDVKVVKKYMEELKQMMKTDYDVLMCSDESFKIYMAFSKLCTRNIKKIRLQGSINKWIDGEEEIDWNL